MISIKHLLLLFCRVLDITFLHFSFPRQRVFSISCSNLLAYRYPIDRVEMSHMLLD